MKHGDDPISEPRSDRTKMGQFLVRLTRKLRKISDQLQGRSNSYFSRPDAATQIQLWLEYRRLISEGRPLPQFGDIGFKCYSQSDEDGILLFLFSVLGVSKKSCVEICAGDGIECNTANLILNHGWHGLLVDGDRKRVERGRQFYSSSPQTYVYPPNFVCSWVTRQGVNDLVESNGFTGEVDLLSLDLDGMDYWVWEALDIIDPRVVVLEYNDILGPNRDWSVPYSDNFSVPHELRTDGMPNFAGASLGAFVKLGRRKGYRLAGVNRLGYNAFFIKQGLGDQIIPEIDVAACFARPKVIEGMHKRFPMVRDLPWQEV
jgi:hypothetical protein